MLKKSLIVLFTFTVCASACMAVSLVNAETDYTGHVVKMDGLSTLYYVASDGKRYVFPNQKTFDTWYPDFNDVTTLSAEELQAIPLGGNVRYRPGIVLIKITTDPKVYAVTKNGRLRWVKTEQIAKKLYGDNWNLLVDDVPDSFFTNYTIGDAIESATDYNADSEISETDTIDGNRGLALGHALRARTAKCRAVPAESNGPGNPATPAVSARVCKVLAGDGNNGQGNDEETDATAPVIGEVSKTIGSTTATISWTTDENTTGSLLYSEISPVIASTSESVSSGDTAATSHTVELENLTASSTYYFIIRAVDESNNEAATDEDSFVTLSE